MTHRLCIDLKLTDLEVARVQIASASWLLQVRHRVAYDYVERSCSDCGLNLSSNDDCFDQLKFVGLLPSDSDEVWNLQALET